MARKCIQVLFKSDADRYVPLAGSTEKKNMSAFESNLIGLSVLYHLGSITVSLASPQAARWHRTRFRARPDAFCFILISSSFCPCPLSLTFIYCYILAKITMSLLYGCRSPSSRFPVITFRLVQ